jgi:hypothetical protein
MPRPATGGNEFGEHAISKPRRPRWTPSEDAKALLEKVFAADSFPTFAVRSQLAEQLSIDSRQVQIWFQNRRQRERLKTGSHATALTEADEEADDSPNGARMQEVVPPRVALLGSLDDGEPSSYLGQSDTQTTWDAQDAGADVTRLADTRLAGGTPDCCMQVPACGPAPVARDPGSPRSAGSDETSHTSLVHPAALSLQTSPLLSSSPALDTLATVEEEPLAPAACRARPCYRTLHRRRALWSCPAAAQCICRAVRRPRCGRCLTRLAARGRCSSRRAPCSGTTPS